MPHVERLRVFPIKSLDGHDITSASLVGPGSLKGDREYAIMDPEEVPVTGKRDAGVHSVQTSYDTRHDSVTVQEHGEPASEEMFSLDAERGDLNAWLSDALDRPVSLVRNRGGGFPDRTEAHGPTIVSMATLRRVADWMELPVDSVRRRFRANVEIGGVPPFWEDGWYGSGESVGRIEIGETTLEVRGPCTRCIVPARDPDTGEEMPGFRERFVGKRRASRPAWVPCDRLEGHYCLAVSTAVPDQSEPRLTVGDPVKRLDEAGSE